MTHQQPPPKSAAWGLPNSDAQKRLAAAVALALPPSYNFEILKTLRRLHDHQAKRVALQLPEGLFCWAEALALIIEEFAETVEDVILIADVTYGACCIDDLKAKSLNCDFLVHYAHSCLVPIDSVSLPCLYVFVDIAVNARVLTDAIVACLPQALEDAKTPDEFNVVHEIALMGSIQFSSTIHEVRGLLQDLWKTDVVYIPQRLPLTPGETLGCTSPLLSPETTVAIFVADGRFHLESAMIQNPHVKFYRYDPFLKRMFIEGYDTEQMLSNRQRALDQARAATRIFVILSTLGRQGSVGLMEFLRAYVQKQERPIQVHTVLVSELMPSTLKELAGNELATAFIQVGCPRLSIDWGHDYDWPLLSPYEAYIALATKGPLPRDTYPMDYFATDGGL